MSAALVPAFATATLRAPAAPGRSHRRSQGRLWSSISDPRVEPGNCYVDRNVEHDEDDRVKKTQVLHHKDVTFADRGIHRIAESRRAEGAFHRDRSRQYE